MREAEIERQVAEYAKRRGFVSLKLNVRGQRGWPDRLFLKYGRALFIEFKTSKGRMSPMQLNAIRRLAMKANFAVQIVRSVEMGKQVLDTFEVMVMEGKL